MNYMSNLLKWDLLLLHRNRLIVISFIVALMYIGIFYLLKPLGNLDVLLIILVFNDPVVTGFLFSGIIILWEKNQNTIEAVRVTPLPFKYYILSKTVLLSLLALITAFIMTIAVKGLDFNFIHLTYGVLVTAIFFIFCGFIFSAYSTTFNHFLLFTIIFLIISSLPFLALFSIGNPLFYMAIPSYAGLILLKASYTSVETWQLIYAYVYLAICSVITYFLAIKILKEKIQ